MSWAGRCMEVLSLGGGVRGMAILSGNQGRGVVAGGSSWTRRRGSRIAGAARSIVWEGGRRSLGLEEGSGYRPWTGTGSALVAVMPEVSVMHASHIEDEVVVDRVAVVET